VAAAALMATNPFLNWYSTETRMYTLVVVLATVGVTLAWRAVRDRRRADAAGAVVTYAALLYTHDWGIYLTLVTAAVLLWVARSRRDRTLGIWIIGCAAAAVVLWLPWLPSFVYQAGNTAAPWAVRPGIGDFFADPASALAGTVGVVVVPLLAYGVWKTRDLLPGATRRTAGLVGSIALLATVVGFLGAEVKPSWTVRYLAIIVAPYLLAAAGVLAATARGRAVLWAVCSVLTVWALIGLVLPNPNSRYAKDNMAAVVTAAAPHLQPGDVVVVTQTEQVPVARHYLPPGLQYLTPTGPVADPTVVDWRNIVARLQQATPCQALSPTLDAMPIGADVLEIDPVRHLGASASAWSRAVTMQVDAVEQFLSDDPALQEVGIFAPGLHPKPYAPVAGTLFQKTSPTRSCA
jgi:mannosyltransferase